MVNLPRENLAPVSLVWIVADALSDVLRHFVVVIIAIEVASRTLANLSRSVSSLFAVSSLFLLLWSLFLGSGFGLVGRRLEKGIKSGSVLSRTIRLIYLGLFSFFRLSLSFFFFFAIAELIVLSLAASFFLRLFFFIIFFALFAFFLFCLLFIGGLFGDLP